jgi:hypothetical protein
MADLKISSLPPATTAAAADKLCLVQGGTTKQITLATLFANVPALLSVAGLVVLGGAPQALQNSGTIDATSVTTLVTTDQVSTANMSPGTHAGQLKVVILSETSVSALTITAARSVVLTTPGSACSFVWHGAWYPLSAG